MMATKQKNPLTREQEIRDELCKSHDLTPDQVTFAEDGTPIFDYEAVSLLSLRLTDIREIECVTEKIDLTNEVVTARCTVTLPDGRTRTTSASAQLNEELVGGEFADTLFRAEAVANSRAARRGIRSVGINLWKAHQRFMVTGELASGHTNHSEQTPVLREIHALASRAGLIVGRGDRERYERFIASSFDGRTSAGDLNPVEQEKLVAMLRALANN